MLTNALSKLPADAQIHLAADGAKQITDTASNTGKYVLAATVALALVAAFFTQQQRRWVTVGTILLIGAFTFMIVGHPVDTLDTLGKFIKNNVWNPILGGN